MFKTAKKRRFWRLTALPTTAAATAARGCPWWLVVTFSSSPCCRGPPPSYPLAAEIPPSLFLSFPFLFLFSFLLVFLFFSFLSFLSFSLSVASWLSHQMTWSLADYSP